MAIFQMCFLSC